MITRIEDDIKQAMRAGDAVKRDALRLVISSLKNAEKDKQEPLADDEVVTVLRRELKRRREAAEAFRSAGAAERAQGEDAEAALIEGYLPAELPDEQLELIVEAAVAKLGATDLKQMGLVMREAMAVVDGRADGSRVQTIVRSRLAPGA